jgi:outer membrane protein TolC
MRWTVGFLTLASGLLAASRPAGAQTVVTLDAVIERMTARNPVLQSARAASDQSAAEGTAARSNYFPRFSFAESWQRSDDPVFVFGALLSSRQFTAADFAIDRLNSPASSNLFRTSLGLSQTLFDGGRRQLADLTVNQTRADLALAAARAYGRALSAQALQAAATSAVSAAEADLARARDRRAAGTATEADVLAVSVHVADLRQRAIQSAGDEAIARAELNRLMGAAVDDDYQVQEPPPPSPIAGQLLALLAEADAASPAIARATAAVGLADAATREAHTAWSPEILGQAGATFSGLQFGSRATAWMAGAQVRWSVSTGGAEAAGTRAAAAAALQARGALEDARAAVHVEVVTAVRQIESARARADVGRAAAAQALERQRIVRDRYEAGLASVSDVLQASTAVLEADSQRVAAVVDLLLGDAALRHALGRVSPPELSR